MDVVILVFIFSTVKTESRASRAIYPCPLKLIICSTNVVVSSAVNLVDFVVSSMADFVVLSSSVVVVVVVAWDVVVCKEDGS